MNFASELFTDVVTEETKQQATPAAGVVSEAVRTMVRAAAERSDLSLLHSAVKEIQEPGTATALFGELLDELLQKAASTPGPGRHIGGAAFLLVHGAELTPARRTTLRELKISMPDTDGTAYEYSFSAMLVAAGGELAHQALVRLFEAGAADPKGPAGLSAQTTLLHFAAVAGNEALVDELLRRGADPAARDRWGQSVALYARRGRRPIIAERVALLAGDDASAPAPAGEAVATPVTPEPAPAVAASPPVASAPPARPSVTDSPAFARLKAAQSHARTPKP